MKNGSGMLYSSRVQGKRGFERSVAKRLGAARAWLLRAPDVVELMPLLFEPGVAEEAPAQLVASLGGEGLGLCDIAPMARVARKRGFRVLSRRGMDARAFGGDPAVLNTLLIVENSLASCYGIASCRLGAHVSFESLDLMCCEDPAAQGLAIVAISADAERTRPGLSASLERYASEHEADDAQVAAVLHAYEGFDEHMRARCDHAAVIAAYLSCHPLISRVSYLGLPEHPCHALAANILRGGFGVWIEYRSLHARESVRICAGLEDPLEHCAQLECEIAAAEAAC